jgi:FlaA1/EpsC-like NDP-sugar epimerase
MGPDAVFLPRPRRSEEIALVISKSSMNGRVVMVTGGLGFIGSNLVNRLVSREEVARIIVLDSRVRPREGLGDSLLQRTPKVEIHTVDIVQDEIVVQLAAGSLLKHTCNVPSGRPALLFILISLVRSPCLRL